MPNGLLAHTAGCLYTVDNMAGADGVGRSTQIALLKEWLETEGYAVMDTGFRRSELTGDGIYRAMRRMLRWPSTSLERASASPTLMLLTRSMSWPKRGLVQGWPGVVLGEYAFEGWVALLYGNHGIIDIVTSCRYQTGMKGGAV